MINYDDRRWWPGTVATALFEPGRRPSTCSRVLCIARYSPPPPSTSPWWSSSSSSYEAIFRWNQSTRTSTAATTQLRGCLESSDPRPLRCLAISLPKKIWKYLKLRFLLGFPWGGQAGKALPSAPSQKKSDQNWRRKNPPLRYPKLPLLPGKLGHSNGVEWQGEIPILLQVSRRKILLQVSISTLKHSLCAPSPGLFPVTSFKQRQCWRF